MDRLAAADVRGTFIEHWPPTWCRLAPPQTAIALAADAYQIIRDGHRGIAPAAIGEGLLAAICGRVAQALPPAGGFLRLGYGSWAGAQLARFGTLRVSDAARVRAILTLADRRLMGIAKRWVRGYQPALYVRPWLGFDRTAEVRVIYRARRPWRAGPRHSAGPLADDPDLLARLAVAIDLATPGAALPLDGLWSLDFAPCQGRWWLLDVNPYAAGIRCPVGAGLRGVA